MSNVNRRDFLNSAFAAVGLAFGSEMLLAQEPNQQPNPQQRPRVQNPYRPFRMGIQSYSLRHFKLDEALAKTKGLGLRFWEGWEGHIPITNDAAKIAEYKEKLKANDITLTTFGVVSFKNDEKDTRNKFEFAKAMGIVTLSAYPTLDSLPLLEKMVEEYKINIAIHNHGPEDKIYGKVEQNVKAFEGRHERIGACIDTGHFLRFDEDPVEAARKFGKRTFGVHLKDVTAEKKFTEIGKGKLDTTEFLKLMRQNQYRGIIALEYEEFPEDPIAKIEECLAKTREIIQKIRPQRN